MVMMILSITKTGLNKVHGRAGRETNQMDAYILDFLPSGKMVVLNLDDATKIIKEQMATARSCHIEKTVYISEEETQEE